jgi:murein DD-endopeptidase MepM/ murein hydrolase activator NlpD
MAITKTILSRIVSALFIVSIFTLSPDGQAQEALAQEALAQEAALQPAEPRPFRLPFLDPPGPSTWLMGQAYGNTSGAYRQRRIIYEAGQGVHFGVDLSARCGYPIVAIGDGVVT